VQPHGIVRQQVVAKTEDQDSVGVRDRHRPLQRVRAATPGPIA
jgi:hypothetical protein